MRFTFDGMTVPALSGESVAAALTASGILALRRTPSGEERGVYCGMGTCFDCVVTIDGRAGQRACLAKVAGGELIRSAPPAGTSSDPLRPLTPPAAKPTMTEVETDILVIGAGPAGLSAALAAGRRGASVIVLDERPQSGGQYFKPLAPSQRPTGNLDRQFRAGAALVDSARAAGVQIIQNSLVWGAFAPSEVVALCNGQAMAFRPRKLILATGAYERPVPVPGWTLPGVMTSGAAQTLVRSYGVSPGKRVVIAGNGPLNFQLAVELVEAGCDVAAIVESARAPGLQNFLATARAAIAAPALMRDGLGYLLRLRRAGVPILWSHVASEIEGVGGVKRLRIAPSDALGAGNARFIEADAVCLGYGFISSTEIARALGCATMSDPRHPGSLAIACGASGETSIADVFVCGDGGAVDGAEAAKAGGTLAGAAAAAQLGKTVSSSDTDAAARSLRKTRRFQDALWRIFAAPLVGLEAVPGATLLCRCESLTFGRVRAEIAGGSDSLAVLKRRLRLGMGRCQGRYCSAAATRVLSEMTGRSIDEPGAFAPRLPAKPFPAGALAFEKPEWSGFRQSPASNLARPLVEEPFAEQTAEIVVVGAGILGSCLAYYLAKEGRDVLVVEREDVNLQSSGANAGSLYVQLLSFDFDARASTANRAASALPLGPYAIALWQEIRADCGGIDIEITGGLMVASNDKGMAFLNAKAELERSFGIDAAIIGQAELRRMAPALSEKLIGAEFVPQEGKIDPLSATLRVLDRARGLGARFLRSADVEQIERQRTGWLVKTRRGIVRAGRIVNAAGAWAAEIGAKASLRVPVTTAPIQMIVTEPAPPLVKQLVAHADRHLSLKQASSGTIILGGAWPARFDAERRFNATTRSSIEGNLWVAREVLPQLSGLHVLRTWAGMNVTIDGAPILGEAPGAPGFYNAVSSNGYTLAPAVARLCVDAMIGRASHLDAKPFSIARFD